MKPLVMRQPRTQFTHEQHAVFMLLFNLGTTAPTRAERALIERFSGLHVRVIQVWFQNERQRRKTNAYRAVVEELNAINPEGRCVSESEDSSSCRTINTSSPY